MHNPVAAGDQDVFVITGPDFLLLCAHYEVETGTLFAGGPDSGFGLIFSMFEDFWAVVVASPTLRQAFFFSFLSVIFYKL